MFVREGAEGRFSQTFSALEQMANDHQLAIAVVGGLAAIHYGYATTTEDVDILLATNQQDLFLRQSAKYGFKIQRRSPKGWHILEHSSGVEINVVPEGGMPRDDAPVVVPSPADVGVPVGLAYASLAGWIELKLGSYRQKDRAHVVEVLKTLDPGKVEEVRSRLQMIHQVLLDRFDELARLAAEESRGPE